MLDSEIKVINAQNEEDYLSGIVINGKPYLYWLPAYKALGITPQHARKVIQSLKKDIHYIVFSREEIQVYKSTVNKPFMVPPNASYAYFLTEEGWNRAIMEIGTGYLNDPYIAKAIEAKKDQIASVFTRYQQGEVISKAIDESIKELPGYVPASAIVEDNLSIAESFIKHVCPHMKIDEGLVMSACITNAEQEIVKRGGDLSLVHLKGMIPRTLAEPPATLTPTQIGDALGGMSSRTVNDLLAKFEYQDKVSRISNITGAEKKEWAPTKKGEPYGEWKPVTAGHSNGSVHHGFKWYWKATITDKTRGR